MIQKDDSDQPTVTREGRRVRVLFEGHEIADSADVLVLREPGQVPVRYFPRGDVEMTVLGQTDKVTHSPSKGEAIWFTIVRDWHIVEDAVWSFEDPPGALAAIAGRIAFQPPHFEFEAEGHTAADWDLVAATPLTGLTVPSATTFPTIQDLADAMRRASAAHHTHEARRGEADPDWPDWYAAHMAAEQAS